MLGDILLAGGLGAALKAYDDITDMSINVSPVVIELLKSLIICLFVLLAKNDFSFAFVTFISLLSNYCVGGVDVPFWESFVYIALFMSFISIRWEGNIIQRLMLAPLVPIGVILEPLVFPEETSKSKTISRILMSIMLVGLQFIPFFNIPFFTKLCIFAASYFVTSIAITYAFSGTEREKLKPMDAESGGANTIPRHSSHSASPPVVPLSKPSSQSTNSLRQDELSPRPERADLSGPDDEGRESSPRPMGGQGGGGSAGDSNLSLSG